MITWITENIGTILISLVLILIVAGIVRSMIMDRRQGKMTCGGNCAHCRMCTSRKSLPETMQYQQRIRK